MAYKTLGGMEWGRSPSGERIYVAGFCKCGKKTLLCETEFKELLKNAQWILDRPTLLGILKKKFNLPKIRIEWRREGSIIDK